jgi:hypothetical protein
VPAVWHWSLGVHTTAVPAWQTPLPLHVSAPLQPLPSLHDVPAVAFVCVQLPSALHVSAVHGLWSSQLAGVHVAAFGNPSSNVYAAFELPTSMSRAMNAPFAQIPVANDSVPFGTSTRARMLPLLPSAAAFGAAPSVPVVPLIPDTSMRMSFAVSAAPDAGPMKKPDPAFSRLAIRICTVPSASTRPFVPIVRSFI